MVEFVNKYAEAFVALTSGMLDTSDIEPYMGVIVTALQKQIPAKAEPMPIVSDTKYFYRCSSCHMGLNRYSLYCDECGQLLDWED